MKATLVLALVACAAAMPSPDPGFVYPYGHPLVYSSYPVVKTVKAETPASAVPFVYSYGHKLPLTYGYPYSFPYTFPYTYPYLVKADEADEEEPLPEEEAVAEE